MDDARPSYYAVIPADVRYDEHIPANAKLLYGEISALIGADGCCFASNAYFASVYKMSERTISGLISKLQEHNYIDVVLKKDPKTGQVLRRLIYLKVSSTDERPLEEIFHTPGKSFREGIENFFQDTNLSNTNVLKENKKEKSAPLSGEQLGAVFVEWINTIAQESWTSEDKNLLYRCLAAFYRPRENKKQQPARSETAVRTLLNRLGRLSGGELFVMCEMLEQSTIAGWKSVFPLNGAAASRASQRSSVKRGNEEWL